MFNKGLVAIEEIYKYPNFDKKKINIEFWFFIHNMFAHPMLEVLHWVGYLFPKARELGDALHDYTIPKDYNGTGR